ncbi:MAG TPA: AMP-binding protein [Clostridiaceae bacterium]|nr:AMP-binding protein [Clostridiaceae bacterium]
MFKYPLYDVREIKDLRDMIQQSEKLYGERNAYLLKDPIATRQVAPRSEEAKNLKIDRKRPYVGVTFRQFIADVRAFGTGLKNSVIKENSRVAILGETRYEWYVSYLAIVNGLAVVVPLDKEQPANEIANLIQSAEVDVLLYSNHKKKVVDEIRDQISDVEYYLNFDLPSEDESDLYFWDVLQEGEKQREEGDLSYDTLPIDAEAMQILLFTSGTTARPKAVMLSHKNVCKNLMAMCSMVYIDEYDVFLSVLPLHHTYECTCGYLCQLYRGSCVAVSEGLRYILQNVQEAKPSIILLVPLMLEAFHRGIMRKVKADPKMLKKFNFGLKLTKALRKVGIDLRKRVFSAVHENFGGNLRLLIAGGASIDGKLLENMQDLGIHCIQGYGLTECAPILALNRGKHYNNNAAGLPLPDVEVRIHEPDENGIGEIIGRGDNVMIGYYNNEEATREAIDEDGFYHTGDLGYLDDQSFVIITGRKKYKIVTKNGKNVFPEEIEFLLQQQPLIAEVVVSGVEGRDGDVIVQAEIFPDREAVDEDPELKGLSLTDDRVKAKVEAQVREANSKLVPYKAVRSVVLRDEEFEKTTAKKIKRH